VARAIEDIECFPDQLQTANSRQDDRDETLDYWMSFDVVRAWNWHRFEPAPFTVRTVPTIGEGETSYPALKTCD
jgi:hypothetical protein